MSSRFIHFTVDFFYVWYFLKVFSPAISLVIACIISLFAFCPLFLISLLTMYLFDWALPRASA